MSVFGRVNIGYMGRDVHYRKVMRFMLKSLYYSKNNNIHLLNAREFFSIENMIK